MKIVFDPDGELYSDGYSEPQSGGGLTGVRRLEYITLCNQLTSLQPEFWTIDQSEMLIKFLQMDAYEKVSEYKASKEEEAFLHQMLVIIFNPEAREKDMNFIGRINILSYQCVILFTQFILKGLSPDLEKEAFKHVFFKHSYDVYKTLTAENVYLNYELMRKFITESHYGTAGVGDLYLRKKTKEFVFLIVIVDYLMLKEIILSFLNKVAYLGFASTPTYADGFLLTPIEFTGHDIAHGKTGNNQCNEYSKNHLEYILDFYTACQHKYSEPEQKKELYKISFAVFYIIHESNCDVFNQYEPYTYKSIFLTHYFKNLADPMKRFQNPNDLNKAIPAEFRGSDEGIHEFLQSTFAVFVQNIVEWKDTTRYEVVRGRILLTPEQQASQQEAMAKSYKEHLARVEEYNRLSPTQQTEYRTASRKKNKEEHQVLLAQMEAEKAAQAAWNAAHPDEWLNERVAARRKWLSEKKGGRRTHRHRRKVRRAAPRKTRTKRRQ